MNSRLRAHMVASARSPDRGQEFVSGDCTSGHAERFNNNPAATAKFGDIVDEVAGYSSFSVRSWKWLIRSLTRPGSPGKLHEHFKFVETGRRLASRTYYERLPAERASGERAGQARADSRCASCSGTRRP